MDSNIRGFITWVFGLMIIQSLCLRRDFAFRFPLVLLGIGLVTLPFINFDRGEMEMARVEIAVQGSLTHPAGLADWFGFLSIFFTVVGVESRRASWRIAARLLALGCLFMVTLSISKRGPLFACALAIPIACRRILKRGFMPTMALVFLACVVYSGGVFNQAYENYSTRGLEDTGRLEIWETTIDRIWQSPFFGVGESEILTPLAKRWYRRTTVFCTSQYPQDWFLILFAAFWIQATWKSISHEEHSENQPFRLPYLMYVLTGLMFGDAGFMSYGALLATSLAAGMVPYNKMRSLPISRRRSGPEYESAIPSGSTLSL